ncbi:MAG TPA: hypothetical protein VGH43_18410 [Jatrophihabitans sp.]|jgi:hypothetical protein
MDILLFGLVAAGILILFGALLIRVRRLEQDVDFDELGRGHGDERLSYTARVIANMTVASP